MKGKHYLFCIGVDKYKSNKIHNLNNAVRDVKTIQKLLIKKYQFTTKNTKSLINEEATRKTVASTLRDYQTILNEDDSLVILFAGHGVLNKSTDEGFWVLNDAELFELESYLSLETIKKIVGTMRVRHVFFIIDSCFSGNIFRDLAPNVEKQFNIPSRICFTSGREEIVLDGPPGVHSPFAETIINTIKSNEEDPCWTVDLCMNVVKNFPEDKKQAPRFGQLQELGDKGGQYMLFKESREEKSTPKNRLEDSSGKMTDSAYQKATTIHATNSTVAVENSTITNNTNE